LTFWRSLFVAATRAQQPLFHTGANLNEISLTAANVNLSALVTIQYAHRRISLCSATPLSRNSETSSQWRIGRRSYANLNK
jgi:hypothetical protein